MASGPASQLPFTTLPSNTMTPYLRAHVEVSDETLRWDSWWTILGFIPIHKDRVALPLADLAATRSRVGFHGDRLVVGLALVGVALVWVRGWMWFVALGVSALLLMMAPTAQLCVTTKDGRTRRLSLCIRHKLDVDLIAVALEILTGRRPPRERHHPRAAPASTAPPEPASTAPPADPPASGPVTA